MEVSLQNYQYYFSCSKRNLYRLHLGYKTIDFSFCQLLAFREKILKHTNFHNLETILNEDNFVLIFVADNTHLLFLDVPQLLELRNLLHSIFSEKPIIK